MLQEKQLVKGKNCVTSQRVFHLSAADLGQVRGWVVGGGAVGKTQKAMKEELYF